nr:unnamed protein product [Callosobruchus chinensis]
MVDLKGPTDVVFFHQVCTTFQPITVISARVCRKTVVLTVVPKNLPELDFSRQFRTPSCKSVHVWPFIVQSRRDFAVSFWLPLSKRYTALHV